MKKLSFVFIIIIISLLSVTVNANKVFEDGKNIYSENVYMVNLDTGKVVFDLNSDKLVYPASLTKIMTCIIAIEEIEDLNETVVIPSGIFDDVYADGGATINLKAGEEIPLIDLIRATMIRSSCDTASAIAYHVAGSVEAFADKMNKKATEIGALSTHFVNAHGLHHTNHYTTAKDLFKIASYALENEVFCEVISEYSCTIPETNKSNAREYLSTIEIEIPESPKYYKYVTGIKSGYTDEAGRCLITKATKNGETYLLVTLGANKGRIYDENKAFEDAITLFEYNFATYSIDTVANKNEPFTSIDIKGGEKESVVLSVSESFEALVGIDEDVECLIDVPENLTAPITKGEKIGSVTFVIGEDSTTRELVSMETINKEKKESLFSRFNNGNILATLLDTLALILFLASVTIITVFVIKIKKKKK